MNHPTLDEVGLRLRCDKASKLHDYLRHIEKLFAHLVNQEITLLEIGVNQGASMRLWEKFFPFAKIIGMDIIGDKKVRWPLSDRVTIVCGSQDKAADLHEVKLLGPFDIIIDDGSHICVHQMKTFGALWPGVKPGGYYVIEDLETSMRGGRYTKGHDVTTVQFLASLQATMHDDHVSGRTPDPMSSDIESMFVIPGLVAIRKRIA